MKKNLLYLLLLCMPVMMLSCGDDDEPDGGSKQKDNHEWVDLGLPSGTLWATTNVGASKPEEYGDYFAWGETKPKTSNYDWSTYKWCDGNLAGLTKYCTLSDFGYNGLVDNKTELDPEDDAAYVNWGSKWRMPTKDQLDELRNECDWQWTTSNGVNGYLVKSKKNSASLFLPAAGGLVDDELEEVGLNGIYWSRTLFPDYPIAAFCQSIFSDYPGCISGFRLYGLSVRAVRVP